VCQSVRPSWRGRSRVLACPRCYPWPWGAFGEWSWCHRRSACSRQWGCPEICGRGLEDGDGACPGRDVCARGPFRGLSMFSMSAGSVCAHVVGCYCLPVSLDFAVCISVCLWVKDVRARVLPAWRVCASPGSVPVPWGLFVFPRASECIVAGARSRSCARDLPPSSGSGV
jgi:hypothetical protein